MTNKGRSAAGSAGDTRAAAVAAVGYKRPPLHTRFKKGATGNSKGRPKGRVNVADLMKSTINKCVTVRDGEGTRTMPAAEAMVRGMVAKAAQGNGPALSALLDVYDMTGRSNEITEEERAKRALHLPASFTREEHDFLFAPARERERQSCRMAAEMEDGADVPASIRAGDELVAQSKLKEALAAYRTQIAASTAVLTSDETDQKAQKELRWAGGRIGVLADRLLVSGQFAQAFEFASAATAAAATPFWAPCKDAAGHETENSLWINVVRAHAAMFLGKIEMARGLYCGFSSNRRYAITTWETSILRDFVRLRKAGHSHPLMEEVEKRFAEEGWTTQPLNTKIMPPKMKGEESVFVQVHPDHVKSGDLLLESGKPHDASAVYLRSLRKCQTANASGERADHWKQQLQIAVERVVSVVRTFIVSGRFISALETVEEAVAFAPEPLALRMLHACALMYSDRNDEARAIFLRHRGETIRDMPWETAIVQEFTAQRNAGCTRPLMREIEQLLSGNVAAAAPASQTTADSGRPDENMRALLQADDITSADRLAELGMSDEALQVYLRCLDVCRAKIAKMANAPNLRAIEDRNALLDKIATLAVGLLANREFAKALDALDGALVAMPNSPKLNIYRAHALMLLDRAEEAQEIYRRYASMKVEGKPAAGMILADFAALRRAELPHPLMAVIERRFAANE